MSVGLPLMKNILTSLAKSFLVPLGLTMATSGTNATILKRFFESGRTALIILNKDIEDLMKIDKYLEH